MGLGRARSVAAGGFLTATTLASHLLRGLPLVCRKAARPVTVSAHWDQCLGLETSKPLGHGTDQVPFG